MLTYILVSLASGILFAIMDGLINANPMAVKLYEPLKPILKSKINMPVGLVVDLAYGFILAGLYWLLYPGLPGGSRLLTGIIFGVILWFLRVVMSVASQWMTYNLPLRTLGYTLLTGLGEMLVLGILYGLTLPPAPTIPL